MFPSLLITKEIRGVCRGWEAQPHHNTKRYTMLPLCFVSFRSVPASLSLEQVSPVRSCPSSLYYYTTLHYTMPYCTTIYSNYLSYRLFIYRRSLQYLCNAMIWFDLIITLSLFQSFIYIYIHIYILTNRFLSQLLQTYLHFLQYNTIGYHSRRKTQAPGDRWTPREIL